MFTIESVYHPKEKLKVFTNSKDKAASKNLMYSPFKMFTIKSVYHPKEKWKVFTNSKDKAASCRRVATPVGGETPALGGND